MKIVSEISKSLNSKPTIELINDRFILKSLDNSEYFLSANEIYKIIFVSNKAEYNFSDNIQNIEFSKIPARIKIETNFQGNEISYSFYLYNVRLNAKLSLEQFIDTSKTGYLLIDDTWFPVQNDEFHKITTLLEVLSTRESVLAQLNILFKLRNSEIIAFRWSEHEYKKFVAENSHFGLPNSFTKSLYDYQESGLKWLQYCCIRDTGTLLGDDMGLGKTAQIISLICWLVENDISQRILVVVPSTLLENWRREFLFFAPSIDVYLHHGNLRTGSTNEISSKKIIITSYSLIVNDLYLFNKVEWDLIIADEASLLKNPESERRIALSTLNRKLFIAMTGTPIENSLLDLWSLVDLISPGYFGSKEEFANQYIKRSIERTIAESDLQTIKNNLNYLLIRRKKEDVLDSLPPRIDIHQALQMFPNEATEYDKRRSMISDEANKEKSMISIFPLIQELRQYTTHPLINELSIDELREIELSEHLKLSNKLVRLFELLDDISKSQQKVLVFTEYLVMIDLLVTLISKKYSCPVYNIDGRKETIARQQEIDIFSEKIGFSVMILNPKTAGMGLNITAANHVIHFTRQWNPALEEQASARSYRNKQTLPVNIYYLYYVNTIEEFIDDRLRQKSTLSSEIITVNNQELNNDDLKRILTMTPKQ
jgi:SNF2 family DNA or RNA helicase